MMVAGESPGLFVFATKQTLLSRITDSIFKQPIFSLHPPLEGEGEGRNQT
jgi:hypothetical protein